MANKFVGIGGNNGNAGTSWATRRLTPASGLSLCGAGDTLIIGAGIYYSVSALAPAANNITIQGDYDGALTDGIGGVTYLCGHTANTNATFASIGIDNPGRTGMTVRELVFIGFTSDGIRNQAGAATITIEDCVFLLHGAAGSGIEIQGAAQLALVVRRCLFWGKQTGSTASAVLYGHSSTVNNAGHVVDRCAIIGTRRGVSSSRIGGVTIRNNMIQQCDAGVVVSTALAVGQVLTVENNRIFGCVTGLQGTVVGEIVEDFNQVYGNGTSRTNTATGANSNTYPELPDMRWWMEMIKGGSMLTPLDLSAHSGLIDLSSGTSPSATDARLAAIVGGFQEWGPLEYNSMLDIDGGGGIAISRIGQHLIPLFMGNS